MSVTQKMFACSGIVLVVVLATFARAVPVPVPEEARLAEYRQFVSAQVMAESADEPVMSVQRVVQVDPAAVRPVRSASPFLGIFGVSGYERPYKTQQHHYHHQEEQESEYHHHKPQHNKPQQQHHHHHQEEQEPEYHHHRPQHNKPQQQHHHHHQEEQEPEYHHHRPQYSKPQHHHQQPQHHGGGGAGSYASAGSFSGGQGGGNGHSQSGANSQSASFGFGPFQASYSASSAHSGSHHSDGGFSNY